MTTRRLSPSRRREDVRAWWAEHLAAQGRSGQTQAAYCRARGRDPKYFILWKGKLQATAVTQVARMVPVVVAPAAQPRASAMPGTASASAGVALRLMLGSGICLSLEIAPGSLPAVARELSMLRC